MKILVTGALGHIGSRFIHSIKPGEFDEVIMLDNLATQRYCSLFDLPEGVKFKFFEENICVCDLDPYFKGVDIVLHFAAMTESAGSIDKQKEVEEVNLLGTERVAAACRKNGCRLFFPSSTSVYTSASEFLDEDNETDENNAQTPYAASKIISEKMLAGMGGNNGFRYVVCRFGTIFGKSKGMRFHTAVNKFCWQAVMGRPLSVWRTALEQKRPYLDLGDCVEAIKFVIKKDLFNNGTYNVVTLNCAVKDIIEAIKGYVPDAEIKYVDSKAMNQLSYIASTGRFEKLGYKFKGDLGRSVKDTVDMLKNAFRGK